ncbi:MAG: hypothetical protein KAH04_06880 [Psychrilyobacter sp.]|nr:hypothetical protein [Psychrilyobacter sp.]
MLEEKSEKNKSEIIKIKNNEEQKENQDQDGNQKGYTDIIEGQLGDIKKVFDKKLKPTLKKNYNTAKKTFDEKVMPTLDEKGKILKKNIDEKMTPSVKKHYGHSKKAIRGMSFKEILLSIKKNFWIELFTNGIALSIAFGIAKGLSSIFVVDGFGNMFGFGNDHSRITVSADTLEAISLFVEFFVSIFVFTFIEKFLDNYVAVYREKKETEEEIEEEISGEGE